jgi:hypothetical protein
VAPFRVAVGHLLTFVTRARPPAAARADVRTLGTSIRVLQLRFATLAAIIRRGDLARFRAMGGLGHPIDNAINAFVSAIGSLEVDIPGMKLPLPG